MKKLYLLAALAMIVSANAYDLHTVELTPIKEKTAPDLKAMRFVSDGQYDFAIVFDGESEKGTGPYKRTRPSVLPSIPVLTNAFTLVFGSSPQVLDVKKDADKIKSFKYLLAVGHNSISSQSGIDFDKLPEQGFEIKSFEKGLAIVGYDSSLVPSYNARPNEFRSTSYGTLYGVIDFCERFLGVRYFFPGKYGTYYEKQRDLTIHPVHYADQPYFLSRGSRSHFNLSVFTPEKVAKWNAFMGDDAVRLRDGSFVHLWRDKGTLLPGGGHCPDPLKFIKYFNCSNEVDRLFYLTPYGRRMFNEKGHIGNWWNVLDLSLADFILDKMKFYIENAREKWDTSGFNGMANVHTLSFGQCDTWMDGAILMQDPIVKELGLMSKEDFDRGAKQKCERSLDYAASANVMGRFFQYFATQANKKLPGHEINFLCYYSAKWPASDKRWKLPSNVSIALCDHRMPKKIFNPEVRANMLQLFREWYEFLDERPIKRAWLYTSHDDLFMRAINPEFVSEVPKLMGKYFGRGSCFYDYNGVDDLWHYYYACYAAHKSQWNPDWDVDKGLDSHWQKFYGEKAGAKIKEFHKVLKDSYIKYFSAAPAKIGFENITLYPAEVYDKLEKLLVDAGKEITPGSVEEKRFNLFKAPWPEAIAKKRLLLEKESYCQNIHKSFVEPTQQVDSTGDVFTMFSVKPRPYAGLRARLDMYMANEKARYLIGIQSTLPKKDQKTKNTFFQGAGHARGGFNGLIKFLEIEIDGIKNQDIEILPSDISPFSFGDKRGYDVSLDFNGRKFRLRMYMIPNGECLNCELTQIGGEKAQKVRVRVNAIPSYLDAPKGKSRFYDYNREVVTARGTFNRPSKGRNPYPISIEDKYYIFQDADYDGSSEDKGFGPCQFTPSFDAVKDGRIKVTDYWISSVELDIDPAKTFRFMIYENRDRRESNKDYKPRCR